MPATEVEYPYLLKFEPRDGYLFAIVEGRYDSFRISKQYWDRIGYECKRGGFTRVLVVERLRRNATLEDAFNHAAAFNYDDFLGIKVAFVDMMRSHHEINAFGAKLTAAHGLNIKLFDSLEFAKEWLLEE